MSEIIVLAVVAIVVVATVVGDLSPQQVEMMLILTNAILGLYGVNNRRGVTKLRGKMSEARRLLEEIERALEDEKLEKEEVRRIAEAAKKLLE